MEQQEQAKDDGGSAFPLSHERGVQHSSGMTLRDYFAAKAMQGLLASGTNWPADQFADTAYSIADAMLRAREAA